MPTIQQLVRFERVALKKKTKSPALKSCPQSILLHQKSQTQL
jgi:small subunit ribosomal protein S12